MGVIISKITKNNKNMSIIKSFSVGIGDMYYIKHESDNFSIIDCMLPEEDFGRRKEVVDELVDESRNKRVKRFISTHPDQDHVKGIKYLNSRIDILNFYCIKNNVIKDETTSDFEYYCDLRDDDDKAFYIYIRDVRDVG